VARTGADGLYGTLPAAADTLACKRNAKSNTSQLAPDRVHRSDASHAQGGVSVRAQAAQTSGWAAPRSAASSFFALSKGRPRLSTNLAHSLTSTSTSSLTVSACAKSEECRTLQRVL
jgi:hypothetical protein